VPALYECLEDQPEACYVIGFITNYRVLSQTTPSFKGPTAIPGDGGETTALHLYQLPS